MYMSKLIVQILLVEASLVLEKAWCQKDEENPNVSWTEYNGMSQGRHGARKKRSRLNQGHISQVS